MSDYFLQVGARAVGALLFIMLGFSTARAQQATPDTTGLSALSVEEGLSRAASQQIGPLEAYPFLQRIVQRDTLTRNAAAPDVTTIATLKELAMRYAVDESLSEYAGELDHNDIAHWAFYALWEQGVPRSYFTELARRYKEDPWPAFYAATILASHPNAETMALLEEMSRETNNNYIDGIYSTAGLVRDQFESYQQMASPREKAAFLIGWAGRGSCSLADCYVSWGVNGHLHIGAVQAREELRRFSRQHPEVSARALAEVELRHGSVHSYWRYVAPYLAENARRAFERMTAN